MNMRAKAFKSEDIVGMTQFRLECMKDGVGHVIFTDGLEYRFNKNSVPEDGRWPSAIREYDRLVGEILKLALQRHSAKTP